MKSEKLITQFSVCFAVLIYFFTVSAHAQEPNHVHVPDSVFRSILRNKYDITFNAENKITNPKVAANLRELEIYSGPSNLFGIEAFTSLEKLTMCCMNLDSLDLAANKNLTYLEIRGASLTHLDLLANKELTYLDLSTNHFATLDLSANTKLENLNCSDNQLTELSLLANTALTILNCSQNQLTTLDLSANKALTFLGCGYNHLTTLDLSAQALLTSLICDHNQLTWLILSDKADLRSNWAHFNCTDNQLVDFDFWNLKMRQNDYYKRHSLIYAGNNFPSYYNNLFPFIKDQIIPLLYKLSFLLVYLFIILYLLFQKHEDGKRNKKLNVWIVVANIILLPVWISYFSPEKLSGIQTAPYIVLILFPSFLIGNFMQLVPLITKLGAVGRQKGTIKLIGLIIVMLYLFYRLAESFFLSA